MFAWFYFRCYDHSTKYTYTIWSRGKIFLRFSFVVESDCGKFCHDKNFSIYSMLLLTTSNQLTMSPKGRVMPSQKSRPASIIALQKFHQSPSTEKIKQEKWFLPWINEIRFILSSGHSDENKTTQKIELAKNFSQRKISDLRYLFKVLQYIHTHIHVSQIDLMNEMTFFAMKGSVVV